MIVTKMKAALMVVLCMGAQMLPAQSTNTRHDKKVAAPANNAAFRSQILNGVCCVPNLSTGYSSVRLKNGIFKSTDPKDPGEVDLGDIIFGQLDGTPVALAVMSQSGGGSGVFNS